jgi:hypothetical protein
VRINVQSGIQGGNLWFLTAFAAKLCSEYGQKIEFSVLSGIGIDCEH